MPNNLSNIYKTIGSPIRPAALSPLQQPIHNPHDGTLDCGCIDICRGVCHRFHKMKQTVITQNPNILSPRELELFKDQLERIEGFENSSSSCRECHWCSKKYPIAFFLFPTETNGEYEPYCIPCLYRFANPTQAEYEDNVEYGGKTYTDKLYASFQHHIVEIARTHPYCLSRILLGHHDPLRTGIRLDTPYYHFQFQVD